MIFPGMLESVLTEDERNNDLKKAVLDSCEVLRQEGYGASADILERMVSNESD